jgi:hypothetical protein
MKRFLLFLSLLAAARAGAAEIFSADLFRDPLWDDGRAEYDVYDAVELREGMARSARVVHLAVKEPFDPKTRVKSDRPGSVDAVKMNQVIDVPTGVYAYHQMLSIFWDRSSGSLVKISLTSNDSCGNAFKEGWLERGFLRGFLHLHYHTYWDGEGDGDRRIPAPAGSLFYDELPMKVRCLRRFEPAEYAVRLFPSIIGSKVGTPAFSRATIRVLSRGRGGTIRIEVAQASGVDRFELDPAPPHLLRSWKRGDGSSLELRKSLRLDYWKHNRPGDEKLLE